MKVLVRVEQNDIDKAGTCPNNCPIAGALRRLFPDYPPLVGRETVSLYEQSSSFRVPYKSGDLPDSARTFIKFYDTNRNCVAPFSFELELY